MNSKHNNSKSFTHCIHRIFIGHAVQQRKKGYLPMYPVIERSDEELETALWERFVHCCTQVPAKDNFYLSWYLRGKTGYDPLSKPDFCPLYLQRKPFDKLKVRCDESILVIIIIPFIYIYTQNTFYTLSTDIQTYMVSKYTQTCRRTWLGCACATA